MTGNNDVFRIDFEVGSGDGDGYVIPGTERPVTVLYNQKIISEEEVRDLIISGEYEFDNRIVVTTPIQADALAGKLPIDRGEKELERNFDKE